MNLADKLEVSDPTLNPESTLTQKTVRGVAWSAILLVGKQLLQILSVTVLAHKIPPSGYGLMSMAAVLSNFLETFCDLGTAAALVRISKLTDGLVSTVIWLNLMFGLVLSIGLALASYPAAAFFHEPGLIPIVQALSLVFFFSSLGVVPGALLNRRMAFQKITIAQFIGTSAGTLAAIIAAFCNAGVWSLVLGSLTRAVVTTIAYSIYNPWRLRWLMDWSSVRSVASYGLHLAAFNVVNYFSRNADNVIIGRFLGPIQLGYYNMAYNLMTYPLSNLSSVICQVLFPALCQVQDDNARLRSAFVRTCMLIGLISFPIMLGLTVTADPFIRVMLGERWLPVAGLLKILAVLGMAQSIYTVVGLIYNAKGRADWQFRWGVASGIVYVLSFFVGLPWGVRGVAISYAIAWTLLMPVGFAIPFRLVDLSGLEFIKQLWPELKPSLLMAVIAALWLEGLRWLGFHQAALQLFSTAAVGVVSYIAALIWWKPPALGELSYLLEQSKNSFAMRVAGYFRRNLVARDVSC